MGVVPFALRILVALTKTLPKIRPWIPASAGKTRRNPIVPMTEDATARGAVGHDLDTYPAGLKYGTDIWSVAGRKVTSTGMPMVTSRGLHSTMLVNIRTPSSSSTRAST